MAVIVDVVIVAALLTGIVLGARNGLLQSLAGVIVVVVAFLAAIWLAGRFADPVAQWLQPILEQRLADKIQSKPVSTASAGDMLALFGFSGRTLVDLAKTVTEQALQTGRSLLDEVVGSVIHSIAYAAICVLSFLVLLLVLRLLIKPLELATKLPGLRTLNGVGGAALGFIESLLLVYLAVWALQKLQLIITPQLIEESMFLKLFVNHSLISLITSL